MQPSGQTLTHVPHFMHFDISVTGLNDLQSPVLFSLLVFGLAIGNFINTTSHAAAVAVLNCLYVLLCKLRVEPLLYSIFNSIKGNKVCRLNKRSEHCSVHNGPSEVRHGNCRCINGEYVLCFEVKLFLWLASVHNNSSILLEPFKYIRPSYQ